MTTSNTVHEFCGSCHGYLCDDGFCSNPICKEYPTFKRAKDSERRFPPPMLDTPVPGSVATQEEFESLALHQKLNYLYRHTHGGK